MFFEQALHDGYECWDGALTANNPIKLAVSEPQSIWGEDVNFDVLLSVGSGRSSRPHRQPSLNVKPLWLADLLKTLLSTMDGERVWADFHHETRILERIVRLNVDFKSDIEQPSLDDVRSVSAMESIAEQYYFHKDAGKKLYSTTLSTMVGRIPNGMIECLAARLRASLFFFEMDYMEWKNGVVFFRGWIYCRLAPDEAGFRELMELTKMFMVAGHPVSLAQPHPAEDGTPFKVDNVVIQVSNKDLDIPVRIDVDFGEDYQVAISGFPMTLKALIHHGKEHCDQAQTSRRYPQELSGAERGLQRPSSLVELHGKSQHRLASVQASELSAVNLG